MPRVTTASGDVLDEIISPRITMDWNAITNGGLVYFHMARLVSLDGVPVAQQDLPNILTVSIADLLTRTFTVPIGQNPDGTLITQDVPVTLVMAALKAGFAQLFDELVGELPSLIDATNADVGTSTVTPTEPVP